MRWPRRVDMVETASFGEVVAQIRANGSVSCVLVDVDNTLVPYGSSSDQERQLIDDALGQLLTIDHLAEIVVHSNAGPQRPGPSRPLPARVTTVWSVGKPWVTHPGAAPGDKSVVVGDLDLIDGLWAWRIGAGFVHLALTDVDPHWFHRLVRRVGRVVRPMFFRRDPE